MDHKINILNSKMVEQQVFYARITADMKNVMNEIYELPKGQNEAKIKFHKKEFEKYKKKK
jgi:hypothetical protein